MPLKYNCRVKLQVTATRWEKQGDHPNVLRAPPEVSINGASGDAVGLLPSLQGPHGSHTAFIGPIWIIECGGNIFPVDDAYFFDNYDVIHEIKDEAEQENQDSDSI